MATRRSRREGVTLAVEAGDEPTVAYYLKALAAVAGHRGDLERAAGLLAAAAAKLQAGGSGWLHAFVLLAPNGHGVEAELRSRRERPGLRTGSGGCFSFSLTGLQPCMRWRDCYARTG